MKTKTWQFLVASALALGLSSTAMAQRGIALDASQLAPQVRETLTAQIEAGRVALPEAYRMVGEIARNAEELDASKRGRFFPYSRMFSRLGADGVLPLIELLAFQGRERFGLSEAGWVGLRAGAIQALGEQRDSRARPVLEAILANEQSEYPIARAAAGAVGAYADDAAVNTLIRMAMSSSPNRLAIIEGMGECSRLPVAEFLVAELESRPAGEAAKVVIEALRDAANAWGWETPAVRVHAEEEDAVRGLAARALMSAFVAYADPQLRSTARKALFTVAWRDTAQLIASARAAHPADAALASELDKLARMMAKSPIR
jgi:hypothetical protein